MKIRVKIRNNKHCSRCGKILEHEWIEGFRKRIPTQPIICMLCVIKEMGEAMERVRESLAKFK